MTRIPTLFYSLFFGLALVGGLFSVSAVSVAHAQAGLLDNYSFDSGLTGWTCLRSNFGAGTIPTHCEALTDSGTTAAQSKGDSRIRQLVYLVPGVYVLSAQARAVTQGNGSSLCNVKSAVYLEASGHSTVALNFGTQNYSYHLRESAPFTITTAVTAVVTFKGNNTAVCGNKSNVDYILLEGDVEEEEEEPVVVETTLPPVAITATCVITESTVTMSDTVPITTTTTTTLSANILANSSFEQVGSNGVPVGWAVYPPSSQPNITSNDNSYTGGRSIDAYDVQETNIYQSLDLPVTTPTTITWYYGAYVQQGNQGIAIVGPHNGRIMLQPSPSLYLQGGITNYVLLSGTLPYTNVVAGGVANYQIKIPQTLAVNFGSAPWYVDGAFLIPSIMLDGQPVVHCPTVGGAEPTEPEENPVGGGAGTGGIPVPTGPAGTVCWECRFPEGRGVELAIAWLGCILRNLFSCDLRIWIMNIVNAILGVFAVLVAQGAWVASQGQAGINWTNIVATGGAEWLNRALAAIQPGTVSEGGSTVWDVLLEFFSGIPDIVGSISAVVASVVASIAGLIASIFYGVISFLGLLITLIMLIVTPLIQMVMLVFGFAWNMVVEVLNAEPVNLTQFGTEMGFSIDPDTSLSFVWGVALVDEWFSAYSLYWVMWILAGYSAVRFIQWLLEELRERYI